MMRILPRLLVGLSLLALASCYRQEPGGITQEEFDSLLDREPSSTPADYRARDVQLRLFGVQAAGDAPFATIAEVGTWDTRNIAVGDLLARNLRVAANSSGGIELEGARSRTPLRAGEDVDARLIEHRHDRAAIYDGKLVWRLSIRYIQEIISRHGVGAAGEQVELFGQRPVRLTSVAPKGLFARMGFREGDLIFAVDGASLGPEELKIVADRVVDRSRKRVVVQVLHQGTLQAHTFLLE